MKVSGTMLRLALLACSALLSVSGQVQDDVPAATIRVDVRLVRVLATVKNPAGALVGSLERADFALRDNGALQDISVFERQTDQPLSVAILIDNSGSTAKDLKYETDSVTRFLHSLVKEGNAEDAFALYSFNWEVVQLNGFTRNVAAVERSLRAMRGEAGTSLYDAVLLASREVENRRGRKVLVIITDGGDTTSRADFQRAVEAAQLADAVIYPILVVPITNKAGQNVGGENALATLALRTGGRVFEPSAGAALDQAFDDIIRDLRTQYLIGFYPKDVPLNPDRFHALTLTTGKAGLVVKSRSGYYGEALAPARPEQGGEVSVRSGGETIRQPKKPQPAVGTAERKKR